MTEQNAAVTFSQAQSVDAKEPDIDRARTTSTGHQEPTKDELREAKHYWGDLFTDDKKCSRNLDGLLLAIAKHISENFTPLDTGDLTPAQLAAFYKAVGGNYDVLFLDTPPNAIAYIYQQLGCLYSLQPEADDSAFAMPHIPALKPLGFIAWQTKQLLLGPEEHVPFIQNALQKFDLIDRETNAPYPKILPADCFPDKPDPDTVRWYENVSEQLKAEHENESKAGRTRSSPAYKRRSDPIIDPIDSSADDRERAANYFTGAANRNRAPRSAATRHSTRATARRPVQFIQNVSRPVVSSVRHVLHPSAEKSTRDGRRRSWHGVSEPDEDSEDAEHLELASSRPSIATRRSRDRARSTSRGSLPSSDLEDEKQSRIAARYARRRSLQSRDSESYGSSRPVSLRREPAKDGPRAGSQSVRQNRAASPTYRPRRRMSHDSPISPQEYFPPYPPPTRRSGVPYHTKRPSHSSQLSSTSPPPPPLPSAPVRSKGFSPSTDASFAAHIAHIQGSSSTLSGSGPGDGREGHNGAASYDHSPRDRPRIQLRDANGRRISREEDFEPRYAAGGRSARRSMDVDREYDDRGALRSRSNEGRYSRERRQRDRAREFERDYEHDEERPRDDRERRQRRTRFAEDEPPNTPGVDGRLHPDWS